jgi:hypothetical protein
VRLNNIVIIILTILGIFCFTLTTLYAYHQENAFVQFLELHAGTLSILVAIAIFVAERMYDRLRREQDDREIKCNSCNAILKEIDDHKDAFTNPNYTHKRPSSELEYVEAFFNTDAYDSVLNSGLFTHFDVDTQNTLSNLYIRIKLRNELLAYIDRYRDLFFLYDNAPTRYSRWNEEVFRYEVSMSDREKEIKDLMEAAEVYIEKELQK